MRLLTEVFQEAWATMSHKDQDQQEQITVVTFFIGVRFFD